MMSFIKICGLTRRDDVEKSIELGATAVGFVLDPASPRAVTADQLGPLARNLPRHILSVGVFVDRPIDEVCRIVRTIGLTGLQLHGQESRDECLEYRRRLPEVRLIKAFRRADPRSIRLYSQLVDHVLLDEPRESAEQPRRPETSDVPFILAGGLTPENVGAFAKLPHLIGVDVARGTELYPGVKDHARLRAFFGALAEIA